MTPIALSPFDLAVAGSLVAASAATSLILALGIQRTLLIAAMRMVLQLLLVGFALRLIFAAASPWITAAAIATMLAMASREVGVRSPRRLAGRWHFAIGALTIVAATLPVTVVVLATALRPQPWFDSRHAIPLVGILLGTVMNAGSLSITTVTGTITRDRVPIEARLALGATRQQALGPVLRQAVLAACCPASTRWRLRASLPCPAS